MAATYTLQEFYFILCKSCNLDICSLPGPVQACIFKSNLQMLYWKALPSIHNDFPENKVA